MVGPDTGSAVPRLAALALLGLSEQATAGDVVAAYRRLAKTTHPDVAGRRDPDAGRRFAALTDAYRALAPTPASPAPATSAPATASAAPSPAAPSPGAAPPRRRTPVRVRYTRPPITAGPVRITPLPPPSGRPR
jgi:hypothetical protein